MKALSIFLGLAVVGLASGGFVLSFDALRDLAIRSGTDRSLAWIWPLVVDGFIVIATVSAFALAQAGRRVTWYPWAALGLFSCVSVIGNAIHAVNRVDTLGVATPVAVAVSAIPAIALLVASHLLVVMIGYWTQKPATTPVTVTDVAQETQEVVSVVTGHGQVSAVSGQPSLAAVQPVDTVPDGVLTKTDRVQIIAQDLADGVVWTSTQIAQRFGLSDRTARRDLGAAREIAGGTAA
ncbi:DUF2637 domain-containing protein [Lysinibacter sp. HNR]|uniref:DUF2637 domain-containing protein n=1 Tax=Lysinibacter sp. HNR TaxID=3031408 RepID=UPI002434CCD1|nr:DUF2637 domain-containing protein [Lysinibacter sp. HNR]WGD37558.1 DUF2637 domain-containing protein [Lysinibacter sp. HNR]